MKAATREWADKAEADYAAALLMRRSRKKFSRDIVCLSTRRLRGGSWWIMEIIIRNALPEDGEMIAAIYSPYVKDTPISFEEKPPSGEEMGERVRETIEQYPYLVAEEGGRLVGYVYASQHGARASYRWSVNVAVYLAATHYRRGIGTLLYRELFALVECQGYAMAYAGITLPNPNSVGLHESLGFKLVGVYHNAGYKLGAWRDVGWWELPLKKSAASNPPEPTPWPLMPEFQPIVKRLS
jgi:phosphinothricin acetyltransferase